MHQLSKYSIYAQLFGLLLLISSQPVLAKDAPSAFIEEGHFFGQARYRYEFVDQSGPAPVTQNAKASTIRANLGFITGEYKGFQALAEGQIVQNIGADNFNDTTNGKTTFPTVADPDNEEINRLWLAWKSRNKMAVKIGRQNMNHDNQRFIGTVGWRQNDQTFDAAILDYKGLENTNVRLGYIHQVKRIFGDGHPVGTLDAANPLIRISHKFSEKFNVAGYGYWFEFDNLPGRSSKTFGVRATGKTSLNKDWSFSYEAEAATQKDHQNNTASFQEAYYHLAPAFAWQNLSLTAGYEVLGGNGTNAFQTPLATLHKFNGWADKFLNTPNNGLKDAYLRASYRLDAQHKALDGTTLTAVYHKFDGERRGDFGSELDISVGKSFNTSQSSAIKKVNILLKYADYDAEDTPFTDTQKLWFQVGVRF